MKIRFALVLLFTLVVHSISNARSSIVKVEIENQLKDLYVYDITPIQFKITRSNGTINLTKSAYSGYYKWSKITVISDQAQVLRGFMKVNKHALIQANYEITLNVLIVEGKDSFEQIINYALPKITDIDFEVGKAIIPYKEYAKRLSIKTTNSIYQLDSKSKYKGLDLKTFQWSFSDSVKQGKEYFAYQPNSLNLPEYITITIKCTALDFQKEFMVPIQQLQKLSLSYPAESGEDGNDGEDGESGGSGENGGHAGGGWHGADGYDGMNVELLVKKSYNDEIKIYVFINDQVEEYVTPINSHISLEAIGGAGGSGGDGGRGGSGGSANDDHEAGSDGAGGPGGNGGNGGYGGHVSIYSDLTIDQLAKMFDLNVSGGLGGQAGSGGYGSPSGTGGKMGKHGSKGVVEYIVMDTNDILEMERKLVKH